MTVKNNATPASSEDDPKHNADPADTNEAGNAGEDEGDGEDQPKKKLVTLERHKSEVNKLKAKIQAFEAAETERKKSEMTEVDRVKAEKAELEQRLSRYEADDKKFDALAKAKRALGEKGLTIDPDKEDALNRSLKRLAFDEDTLDDDVAELVQIAAMPKTPGHKSVAGKAGKPDDADRDPMSYTGKELGEILKESPERYHAIMAKRKAQLAKNAGTK